MIPDPELLVPEPELLVPDPEPAQPEKQPSPAEPVIEEPEQSSEKLSNAKLTTKEKMLER